MNDDDRRITAKAVRGRVRVTVPSRGLTDRECVILMDRLRAARFEIRWAARPQCWSCGTPGCSALHVGQIRAGTRGRGWERVHAVVESQGQKTWRLRPIDGGKAFYVKRTWGRFVGWVGWAMEKVVAESWNQWVRAVRTVGEAAHLADAVSRFGRAMGALARAADYSDDGTFQRFRLLECD